MPRSGAIQIDADLNVGSVYLDAAAQKELDGISKKLNNLAKRHGFGSVEKMVGAARGAGFSPAMAITYTRRQLESVRGQRLDLGQVAGLQYIASKMYNREKNDIAANKAQIREAKRIEAEEQKNMAAEADHAKLLQFGSLTQIRDKIAQYKIGKEVALKHGWSENDDYIKGIDKMVSELESVAEVLEQEVDAVTANSVATKTVAGALGTLGYMLTGVWNNNAPVTNLYERAKGALPAVGAGIGAIAGPGGALVGGLIGGALGSFVSGVMDFIHGAWRTTMARSLKFRDRWAVLGAGWNNNFAENLSQMYGINENSLAGVASAARYFKVDAAYGQISEQQMIGHSILRNWHAAVMAGADIMGQVAALRQDYLERGPEHFHRGLSFNGFGDDLMSIMSMTDEQVAKAMDPESTRNQEISDMSNNVQSIDHWAERAALDLAGVREAVDKTYKERMSELRKKAGLSDDDEAFYKLLGTGKLDEVIKTTGEDSWRGRAAREIAQLYSGGKAIELVNNITTVSNVDGAEVKRETEQQKNLLIYTQSMVR